LRLLLIGSLLGAVIGVLLGVWGAVRQYRASDQIVTYASFVVIATPTFVIGVLLMILATQFNNLVGSQVITFTGEYTAGITGSWWDLAWDRAVHLLLPTSRSLIGAASFSRYQRSVMLDVLGADYIRTARSKGLPRTKALFRHGVRLALIPMSTFFAYSFGTLIAGPRCSRSSSAGAEWASSRSRRSRRTTSTRWPARPCSWRCSISSRRRCPKCSTPHSIRG
jgi:peptide/nickel transport system permease protein